MYKTQMELSTYQLKILFCFVPIQTWHASSIQQNINQSISINQFIRQVWQQSKHNKQWWQDKKAVNCTNSCPRES